MCISGSSRERVLYRQAAERSDSTAAEPENGREMTET